MNVLCTLVEMGTEQQLTCLKNQIKIISENKLSELNYL